MTTGLATLDFGAFPGASDASLAVTGQTGILSGSYVEAWLRPAVTTDHTADEHLVETIKVVAGNISAGVGFTIYGINTSELGEPVTAGGPAANWGFATATTVQWVARQPGKVADAGGKATRIYGTWSVAWVWT
jgi:hypothetical protein